MSFKSRLEIDGNTYRVLDCEYEFKREIDQFGKPAADVRGGQINITIESSGTDSFVSWATSSKLRKAGSIIFEDPTEDAALKTVEFEDAYCIAYKERFSSAGEKGMTESFVVSAKKMKVGEAEHENSWFK